MMMFMHFTFQIILLAVGFGVGYSLLVIANKQEGQMKDVGKTLGWVLIAMAIILSLFSLVYSMKIAGSGYTPIGDQQKMQRMDNETDQENENLRNNETRPMMNNEASQENGEMQEESQENENKPIKSNIKDHE